MRTWLLAVPLLASQAFGAVTLDATSASTYSNGSSTYSWAHTVGSGTNSVMWVGISYYNGASGVTVSSVQLTGCGGIQDFTKLDQIAFGRVAESWWLASPHSGSCTVLVTFSGTLTGTYDIMQGGAVTVFGAAQTTPTHSVGGATTGGGTQHPTYAMNVPANGSYMVAAMTFQDAGVIYQEEAIGQGVVYGSVGSASQPHGNYRPVNSGTQSFGWYLYSASVQYIAAAVLVPVGSTATSSIRHRVTSGPSPSPIGGSAVKLGAAVLLGASNTQALLSYTAPDNNPCTVQVSERASLRPLVHDLNGTLFAGANQDSRAGAFTNGKNRIMVVGKRATEQGLDSAYYSRALQAYKTHYFKIACGAASTTGSFATINIPVGNTYNELVQVNPATGSAIIPTFPNDRNTTTIDPQTGILGKRVSLDAEGTGLSLYSGGRIPMCGYQLVGPGPGYLCSFPDISGSPSPLYYILPSTGEVRYLGIAYKAGVYSGGGVGMSEVVFDPSNPLSFYSTVDDESAGHTLIVRFTYSGDYSSATPGAWATLSSSWVTGDLKALLVAYNPTFDPAKFNCSFLIGGQYGLVSCKRGIQDSYGWMFAMKMSDASIIGGINVVKNVKSRWCGSHSTFIVANTPLVGMLPHELSEGVIGGPNLGLGPYETKLAGAIGANDTTFTVAGEPLSTSDPTVEPYLMDAAIGDAFILGFDQPDIKEFVTITGKSGTNWTVNRQSSWASIGHTKRAWPSGTTVRAWCENNADAIDYDMWWKFLVDPTGTGSGYFPDHYIYVSHKDASPDGQVSERAGVIGDIMNGIDVPLTYSLSTDPLFAGAKGWADGNSMSTYPAYHQLNAPTWEKNWFLDEPAFFGAAQMGTGATLLSGQLYKYVFGDWGGLNRKQLVTLAAMGDRMLTDISGPGSLLTGSAGDSYKYCVANVSNECVSGSSAGDVFANVPGLAYTDCKGFETGNFLDLCIANLPQGQGAYQFGFLPNTVGIAADSAPPNYGAGYTRKLSTGFGGVKDLTKKFKVTSDGSWGFITKGAYWNPGSSMLMLKIPPFPTPDSVDRSTFVRAPIAITVPQGQGIARAAVRFGYAEQGTAAQYYCTSRRESCLAMAGSVADANPFQYEDTDTYTALSCSTACTIVLPVLPMHVAYYQVRFYDASGKFVTLGAQGVALEGAAVAIP